MIAAKTTQNGSTSPDLDRAFADIPAAYDRDRRGSHDRRLRHHRDVPDRTLTQRALNRALLARQLLLERSTEPIDEAVDLVGGLQTQYAPSGYVGLWSRLADFRRGDLTAALEDGRVIQATLMRMTIHMVSRREYWRFALGVRQARRVAAIRTWASSDRPG